MYVWAFTLKLVVLMSGDCLGVGENSIKFWMGQLACFYWGFPQTSIHNIICVLGMELIKFANTFLFK